MPVPANVLRCNINATMTGEGRVVHTVHVNRLNTATTGNMSVAEVSEAVRDAWATMLYATLPGTGTFASVIGADLQYESVTAYDLDADGKATTLATTPFVGSPTGTDATCLPYSVAVCASLLTAGAGRRRRGRFYIAAPGSSTLAADGRMTSAARLKYAEGIAMFLQNIKDESETPGLVDRLAPVVLSKTGGFISEITSVSVGDVYDTMRSRRNGLTEGRVTVPLA